jgi:hypothetical protein
MSERNRMLQALEDAHEQVVIAAIYATERGAKGTWGPCEILAHIVGWEVIAIECLPGLLPSEAPAPLTYDAMNKAMVTLIGNQPIEVFCDMLHQAHERFVQMPQVQDEASYVPGNPIYERICAAIGHSLEHVQELQILF